MARKKANGPLTLKWAASEAPPKEGAVEAVRLVKNELNIGDYENDERERIRDFLRWVETHVLGGKNVV